MKCERCRKRKATERDFNEIPEGHGEHLCEEVDWRERAMRAVALLKRLVRSLGFMALSGLSACSTFVEQGGPEIICHATKEPVQCPLESGDGVRAVEVFSLYVMPLSSSDWLEINWYDWDEAFEETGNVAGYTESPNVIHVRNHKVMMHELAHVALWRETGDADPNHESPPGAWGNALNTAIEAAASKYGVANPSGNRDAAVEP